MAKTKESKTVQVVISDGARYAGPRGNFGPGDTLEVSETEAKQLVSVGAAERVDSLPAYKASGVANRETADEGRK